MGSRLPFFVLFAIASGAPAFAAQDGSDLNGPGSAGSFFDCGRDIPAFAEKAKSTIRSISADLKKKGVPAENVRRLEGDFRSLLGILKPESRGQQAEFDRTLTAVFALHGRYPSDETFERLADGMREGKVSRYFSSMAAGLGQGSLSAVIETVRLSNGAHGDSEVYTRILRSINNPVQILEVKSLGLLLLEFVNRSGGSFAGIRRCVGQGEGVSKPLLESLLAAPR